MKAVKIVITISMIAALLSCNREITITNSDAPKYIAFENVTTKAGLTDIQSNGFGVWALFYNEAQPSGHWLLEDRNVELKDGEWTYGTPELWIDNSFFGFFGVYPKDTEFSSIQGERNKTVELNYETPDDADEDILVAISFVDTSGDFEQTVQMPFKHLFSKINIKVKQNTGTNERDNFIVDKITLKGVKGKGVCSIFVSQEPEWTFDNSTKSFTKEFSGNTPIGLKGEILFSENGLLLIPQDITANSIEVEIAFRFGLEGNTDVSTYESKTYKAYLPPTTNWEYGKAITYTALLSTYNPIVFEAPTIESWGGSQSSGTIIIK